MNVFENASYEARNLVSFKRRMTASEMPGMIDRLKGYIASRGAERTGLSITCTYEIDTQTDKSETEVFMPVNKALLSTQEFTFTPHLRLDGCFMIKHRGAPELVALAYSALKDKMASKGIEMKPPFYHVYVREALSAEELELFEIDIYCPAK